MDSMSSYVSRGLIYGAAATAIGASALAYYYAPKETQSQISEYLANIGSTIVNTDFSAVASNVGSYLNYPIENLTGYVFHNTHPFQDSTRFAEGSNNLDDSYIRTILNIQTISVIGAVASKGLSYIGRYIESPLTKLASKAGYGLSLVTLGLSSYQYVRNSCMGA